MTVLGITWFTNGRGSVGIARVRSDETGEVKYYLSAVDGFNEAVDTNIVASLGARFPNGAGDALFGITHNSEE